MQRGELVLARDEVNAALQRPFPPDSEWPARLNVLKAEILLNQGLYKESFAVLESPLPASLDTSDAAVLRSITQGSDAAGLRRFSDADSFLTAAEYRAQISQPQLLGQIALARGTLEFHRGNWAAAERHYRNALQLARQQKDPFLTVAALGSMGFITTWQGRFDESADWNAEALKLARSVGANDSVSRILGNLAWSYQEMGDFEKALSYHKESEEASERSGVKSDRIQWLNGMAFDYFELRNYQQAEATWQRALTLARDIDAKPYITEVLNNLTDLALEENHLDDAEQQNREAAEIEKENSDPISIIYTTLAAARIQAAKGEFAESRKLFEKVVQDRLAEPSVRWSAESRLAQVYAEQGRPSDAEALFRKSIETIEGARTSIRSEEFRLSFLTTAIEFYNNYIQFLVGRGRSDDALQVAELSRARTLADGLDISTKLSFPLHNFEPSRTAASLKSVILSYWLGSPRSYVWIVSPAGVDHAALPPAAEIELLVNAYRQALVGPRDPLAAGNSAGQQLFDMLVAPAQKHIPPQSRVVILPDASLYNLNFETLIASSPHPHYWIDDATIDYANSLVLLAATPRAPAPPKKLLLIGAPVSPSADFPDLPQAPAEIDRVENHFPTADRVVIEHDRATPSAYFDSQPAQFSFIHFVAHGVASRTSPLDSAVILTRQGDGYKLYARDVVGHPINAAIVTISACHGAGDRAYSGEGLVGLNWAFLRAGARGVISALWEVDDNSTPQLMDHLYDGITKGESPDAALREAKLSLLHSGTIYQKPFYWAPFELYRGV